MNRESVKIICDIIKEYMNLENNQIWIYNQDYKIPNTNGLFVIVSLLGSKVYGINNKEFDNNGELVEEISTNLQEQYQIDIQSKDSSARKRKEEIIEALNSNISQQKQEQYFLKIARLPSSFINTSSTEEPAVYTKFTININVLTWKKSNKNIDYYNNIVIDKITEE